MINTIRSFITGEKQKVGFATKEDIEVAGLLSKEGIILGMTKNNQYIRDNSPDPILVTAPTRSGKGVGIVIPSLLTWEGSALIFDIFEENYHLTSGYRQNELGNKVLKFYPYDETGTFAKFNPLDEIRIGTEYEIRDTQDIVNMLLDTGRGKMIIGGEAAFGFLVGVILHLKYTKENASLPDVGAFLKKPACSFDETLETMLTTNHSESCDVFSRIYHEETTIHPVVASETRHMFNKSDKEQSSILHTIVSCLAPYCDPIIAKNIARSDFHIADLIKPEQPLSLYMVNLYGDYTGLPLFRMITYLAIKKLSSQDSDCKQKVLLLLDDFPKLGQIPYMEENLSGLSRNGVKPILVIQDLNQLRSVYSPDNNFTNECINIVFPTEDMDTAKYFSEKIGLRDDGTPLLIPYQIMANHGLHESVMILNIGSRPIYAKKVEYYKDPALRNRVQEPVGKTGGTAMVWRNNA